MLPKRCGKASYQTFEREVLKKLI